MVYFYSTIKMMHGPVNLRVWDVGWIFEALMRDQYRATLSMVMNLRAQLVEPLLHSVKANVKQPRYRPGVAQRVPAS